MLPCRRKAALEERVLKHYVEGSNDVVSDGFEYSKGNIVRAAVRVRAVA